MYIKRSLSSALNKPRKSVLLLGPRQTGKSTLIETLKPDLTINLDLSIALETGMLPGIYIEKETAMRKKILQSYSITYLKEEIQAEALTRNIEGFSRFLYAASALSGNFLDISKLASQAQVPRESAVRYFEILEDTLIVRRCEAFSKNVRKR